MEACDDHCRNPAILFLAVAMFAISLTDMAVRSRRFWATKPFTDW